MTLTLKRIVKREPGAKSFRDYRRRVNRVVVEYWGDDGEIYRKSFEAARPEWPGLPAISDHAGLADVQHQWTPEGRRMLVYTRNLDSAPGANQRID